MSNSDKHAEERVEYFYNLIHHLPGVDDVLEELRKSSLLKPDMSTYGAVFLSLPKWIHY